MEYYTGPRSIHEQLYDELIRLRDQEGVEQLTAEDGAAEKRVEHALGDARFVFVYTETPDIESNPTITIKMGYGYNEHTEPVIYTIASDYGLSMPDFVNNRLTRVDERNQVGILDQVEQLGPETQLASQSTLHELKDRIEAALQEEHEDGSPKANIEQDDEYTVSIVAHTPTVQTQPIRVLSLQSSVNTHSGNSCYRVVTYYPGDTREIYEVFGIGGSSHLDIQYKVAEESDESEDYEENVLSTLLVKEHSVRALIEELEQTEYYPIKSGTKSTTD